MLSRPEDTFAQLDLIPLPREDVWVPVARSRHAPVSALALVALIALLAVAIALALHSARAPLDRELVPAETGRLPEPSLTPPAVPSPSAEVIAPASPPRPAATAAPTSPPGSRPGVNAVSGTVYEVVDGVRRPIAGQRVFAYTFGGTQLRLGYSVTDENGHYEPLYFGPVWPNPLLVLFAAEPPYVQPEAVMVDVRSDVTVDIELMTEYAAARSAPRRDPPLVSGTVFQVVDGARRPAAGARVYLEWSPDFYEIPLASTTADANGRFMLGRINLPPGDDLLGLSAGGAEVDFTATKSGATVEIEVPTSP